ncbi:hypothetical protein V6N12_022371 [Hibiscus sabdariffa]|uniref:Uncharacterized protein n=1 Tax=Hibiscus sabdariffa TaxID=183260 RepID=A0ABR2FUH5_9ROSI
MSWVQQEAERIAMPSVTASVQIAFKAAHGISVSVPCSSLLKTVTVRCGHCTNLLSVSMGGLLLPAANQLHFAHSFFTPQNLILRRRDKEYHLLTIASSRTKSNVSKLRILIYVAFSAAAKNWAHFPHLHFGLMPDRAARKTNVRQQEREEVPVEDGYFMPTQVDVSPCK